MRRLIPLLLLAVACQEYEVSPFEVVDVFIQDPADKVDILLVIDNSGSMLGYQLLVGARFNEFLTYFTEGDVDYHIGVTTTTMVKPPTPYQDCPQEELDSIPDAGHLVEHSFITPSTEDAAGMFARITRVGTCGSGDEKGLEAAATALSEEVLDGPNFGFIRNDASLSIIFVSDEQDNSFAPVSEYINSFYLVKGQRERGAVNASALVITDADDCLFPIGGSTEGSRYVAVAEATDGITGNLCNTDFETIITELSLNASRLRDTFFLSEYPALETLEVTVDDEFVPCQQGRYDYELIEDVDGLRKPAIVFERVLMPRSNERLAVRYNRGSGDPANFCLEPQDADGDGE